MGRKRGQGENPPTPFRELAKVEPVLTVGMRDARDRFKEAIEAGVPIVITNHGRFAAALIPVKSGYWHTLNEEKTNRKTLLEAVNKILEHLRI
jgi:prevent-host-death family protein